MDSNTNLPIVSSCPMKKVEKTTVKITDKELNMGGYAGPRRETAHVIIQNVAPVFNTPCKILAFLLYIYTYIHT